MGWRWASSPGTGSEARKLELVIHVLEGTAAVLLSARAKAEHHVQGMTLTLTLTLTYILSASWHTSDGDCAWCVVLERRKEQDVYTDKKREHFV